MLAGRHPDTCPGVIQPAPHFQAHKLKLTSVCVQSVLGAIYGLQYREPQLSQGAVVGIACAIIILIFVFQARLRAVSTVQPLAHSTCTSRLSLLWKESRLPDLSCDRGLQFRLL